MRKTIRPTTTHLPAGQLLPDDLAEVLRLAVKNARSFSVDLTWKDGAQGLIKDVADISTALEDPQNLRRVSGYFHFDDGYLSINIATYEREASARGQKATDNLTAINAYLAVLPGISRMSADKFDIIRFGVRAVMILVLFAFGFTLQEIKTTTPTFWWLFGTYLLAAVLAEVAIRTSSHARASRRLITYQHPTRWDASTSSAVASAIATVGALAVAIYAAAKS